MSKMAYYVLATMLVSFVTPIDAQVENETDAYKTQVPPGMELQQVGKRSGYRVVLPKGTTIRREADIRIIEGTGEYASRKFLEYDALLDKMNADIEALRKDVEDIKKAVTELQKPKLASK